MEESAERVEFVIPSQALDQALLEFSRQSGLAVLIPAHEKLQSPTPKLNATLTRLEALAFLLQGSSYRFQQVEGQGLVVLPIVEKQAEKQSVQVPDAEVLKPLLEEVVVTASRRLTQLQDTPMAITALNRIALDNHDVSTLFDLTALVPNLQMARNGDHSASLLYIRGIGSDNYTEAGDPGIATHIDGIYSSRSQGTALLLYDLEQVEVLRGPQGTLFGRNSTGGVINYHSKKPVQKLASRFDVGLGDYQQRTFQGMVNVPMSDRWALRLAAATEKVDGFVDYDEGSVFQRASESYNNTDLSAFRLSSLWEINDRSSWWLSYEDFRDQGAGYVPIHNYETPVLIDTPGHVDLHLQALRSRFDWQLGEHVEFTYIAGYSQVSRDQEWDGDRSGAIGSETDPADYHQSNRTVWSEHSSRQHEIQFKNAGEARFNWLLAYFKFAANNGIRFDLEHQDETGSGWGGAPAHSFQQPSRGSEFEAVYGQLGFDFNHRWRASVGARSGRDLRYDRGGRNIACPDLIRSDRGGALGDAAVNLESALDDQCYVVNYNDVSQSWSSTTYMARLEYRPKEDFLLYWLFAEGFKPGIVEDGAALQGVYDGREDPAFQAALQALIEVNNGSDEQSRAYVEPEQSKNLEFGFKFGLLDGALTLNGALFNTRYSDLQVSGVAIESDGSEIFRSTNAAAASIRGLELELNWANSLGGQLTGHLALLDASYDRFLAVDRDFPRYGQTWNPSANNPDVPDLVDYSGNQLKQAPKVSLGLSYSHAFRLRNGAVFTPQLSFNYSGIVYFDEANREQRSGALLNNLSGVWEQDPNGSAKGIDFQPAYSLWGASLKYEPQSGAWKLVARVNNIGDELVRSDAHGPESAQPSFYVGPPRTVSVSLSAQFE